MYSSSEEDSSRNVEDEEKSACSEHAVGEMAAARLPQSASVASLALQPQPFAMRKGSRPNLNATTTQPFDSKAAHNKRLYSRGVIKMKEARNTRRQLRDTIIRNDDYTQLHPTLQSSSESESESSENSNWKRETVDWQSLAHETWWAKESLFGIMPVPEISSLVGWATHHTHDGTVVAMTETTAEESANDENATDSPLQDNVTNDDEAICIRTERDARSVRPETNPLLFLPNTPLPPSHLRYLTEKAREYVEDPIQNRDVWESHTFLASSDSSDNDEKAFKTKYKPKDWQQWEYDAEDETYRATKELLKKRKRLLTMHVPCPTSKVDPKRKKDPRTRKAYSQKSHLYKSLDDSALVALGMAWEEMITASLLPLAQQHVARCRRLEHNIAAPASSTDAVPADPFQEWTLPPEQAIWRLAQEGVTTGAAAAALPSAHALERGSQHLLDRESSVRASLVNGLGNSEQRKQQAVDEWCHTHGLDPALVSNNMDIYGVFLPRPPTVLPRKPMLTDREREDRSDKLDRKQKRLRAKSEKALVADDELSMESNDSVE